RADLVHQDAVRVAGIAAVRDSGTAPAVPVPGEAGAQVEPAFHLRLRPAGRTAGDLHLHERERQERLGVRGVEAGEQLLGRPQLTGRQQGTDLGEPARSGLGGELGVQTGRTRPRRALVHLDALTTDEPGERGTTVAVPDRKRFDKRRRRRSVPEQVRPAVGRPAEPAGIDWVVDGTAPFVRIGDAARAPLYTAALLWIQC